MSVAITITGEGDVVTPWGLIEHPCPRPDRGDVGHLMLVLPSYVDQLSTVGPSPAPKNGAGVHSVTTADGRTFAHHDYGGRRWTWELFPAHFTDRQGPDILVGRWPD